MDKSFEWIEKAISSSTSRFHLECCEVLIELFANKYKPDAEEQYNILIRYLHSKRIDRSPDASKNYNKELI